MERLGVALACLVTVAPAFGQAFDGSRGSFPGCPLCGVFSYVDAPAAEQTISASNFIIQGWGFECVSGRPVDRVDVHYQNYAGYWVRLPQDPSALDYGSVARPDVRSAYQSACPTVPAHAGWTLAVTNPPPLGLRRIAVLVWRGPYVEQHFRTYLIVP